MNFDRFSERQLLAMNWWKTEEYANCDGLICDGSVRSGKTLAMTVGFLLWSMLHFEGMNFAICGKSIGSLRRNVALPMQQWLDGVFEFSEVRSENKFVISLDGRHNTYYLFAGYDESSYALIQGMTLAGVLFDEVVLMARSFVEQAVARCSVAGSKFWFNCNPEGPQHWFYTEWVQKAPEKNLLRLKLTMDDNPSLDSHVKARYESLYTGAFYARYVRGEWAVAEGLIYHMFDPVRHVVPAPPGDCDSFAISCDYGTHNPTSAGLWGRCGGKWYRLREYYYDGRRAPRTDEEHYAALEALASGADVRRVIVDPSAASFIETIRRHGRFTVERASNRVLDGIREVAEHLRAGDLLICQNCEDCIREFALYRWDEKAAEDRPVKADDHAMDDLRYFVRSAFGASRFSF